MPEPPEPWNLLAPGQEFLSTYLASRRIILHVWPRNADGQHPYKAYRWPETLEEMERASIPLVELVPQPRRGCGDWIALPTGEWYNLELGVILA